MSTLITLLSRLQNELKLDPNNRVWSQDTKETAIQDAYFQVQADWNFWWGECEESTTISAVWWTVEYTLPTDFLQVSLVELNDQKVHKVSKAYVQLRNSTWWTWKPSNYYIYWNKIWLYPTPDASYTLNMLYRKRLETLSSIVDSEFWVDFDVAIVSYAAYLLFSQIWDPRQDSKLQKYEQQMNRLKLWYIYKDLNNTFWYQRENWIQNYNWFR